MLYDSKSALRRAVYLLGMSMWMLTEENKNELLKQRDTKMAELNQSPYKYIITF